MNKKVIVLIMLLPVILLHSKNLIQYVHWIADYDTTGKHWVVYNLYSADIDFLDETSIGSDTPYIADDTLAAWMANIDNFQGSSPPWDIGDTIVALGSIDTAYVSNPGNYGTNSSHTGFYWIYSDTVLQASPEWWSPDDTLRVMPQPYAYQVGGPNGDIQIEITNPAETRRVDQTEYDVLGYWIWADTTGAGTPDVFNDAETAMEVGFASVDGGPDETTIYSHPFSNYHDGQTVYWAYKLVARPDTTAGENPGSPGYATHYFSQNSNSVVIVGIEENRSLKPGYVKFEISPNPFTDRTDITCSIGQSAKSTELKIYDISGKLVKDFSHFTLDALRPTLLSWYGTDESGEQLPSGVYFVQVKGGDLNLTKKVILQR